VSEQHPRIIQAQIEALQNQMRQLQVERMVVAGGSGPHDPGMEARVAKLESDVGHIQGDVAEIKTDLKDLGRRFDTRIDDLRKVLESDFRLLFGALIVATLGLAGVMAKGFHWF
jgi:outer membrane murein-binding lipoprotein Lpp